MAIEKTKSKTNHDFSQIVVLPKYYFYCQSKRIIKNPIELIKVLKLMHDDEFNYHVTDTKNDFADWIVNVFGADDLATNINDLKTKKEMLECIEKYFEESIMMDQHKDKISNTGEFEKISETVVISNEKGIIQYVNPSFTKYSGYSKNEVIGKNPKLLKSGRHGDEFYEILWKNILSGKTFHTNFINKAKDGHLYKQQPSISPVKNKDGKIVQFISK